MEAHYAEIAGHIYLYEDGGSYENRSVPVCTLTVSWMGPKAVWISGARGKLDKPKVRRKLREMGVETVWFERDGKLQMIEV